MNNSKAFNKLTEKYYEVYGKNPEYKYFLEELTDLVRKGKIIDIGCGSGLPVSRYLVDRGYDVTGVDFSKKMVAEAKKNVPEAEILYEDILKLDLDQDKYDGAVCFFTFNYLNKKEMFNVFENITNSLKEEAGIIIGAIEGEYEGEEKLLGEKVYIRYTTEPELRQLLSKFNIERIERRDYSAPDEKPQVQIYVIAKKKSWHELSQNEGKKETKEEVEESNDQFSEQLEKVLAIGKQGKNDSEEDSVVKQNNNSDEDVKTDEEIKEKSSAKIRYDDSETDDEEPAIRITFFKKSK